jgi:long-chain acyl-CoA synthetase
MDFTRLFDILDYQHKRFPRKDAFANRNATAQWEIMSTEKAVHERNCMSAGLLQMGFHRGQRMGIITHCGSTKWMIADLAMLQIGMVPVPIHATARPDEIAHIIKDAELVGCFVSNEEMLQKVTLTPAKTQNPEVIINQQSVTSTSLVTLVTERSRSDQSDQRSRSDQGLKLISFEPMEGATPWDQVICEPDEHDLQKLQYLRDMVQPSDLATILYTSGSTGMPKGVMLTHNNIVSNIKSVLAIVPVDSTMIALSFLPLSHIFERTVCYLYQAAGTGIWFSDSMETLPQTLKEVRPHFFAAVPRVLERSYDRLKDERDKKGYLGQKIINWALALGERFPFAGGDAMPFTYRLQWMAANILVFRKWRKAMGGRLSGIVVGAAALQPRLGRLFSAAGVAVREGYGLTETSPVVAFNRFEPGGVHFGTVGIPAPGVDVRINAPDENGEGEVEVKGYNVMSGYLNLPEETREKFTEDGWLRTGDKGKFEYKRFLRITGRISEIFKTTAGKFVAPAFVEQQLRTSPFIEHALVYGLNQPTVSAIIVPDFAHLEHWCQANKVHWTAPEFMIINPKIEKLFREEMDKINEALLGQPERIKDFKLVSDTWTAENGMLTPSLKLRRTILMEKYIAPT